jgi:DNA-directed RNA polymerase specialized sigma24 family protein
MMNRTEVKAWADFLGGKSGNESFRRRLADSLEAILPRAAGIVVKFLGDDADARDVVTTVLLAILESSNGAAEIRNVDAYILRSVRNECLARRRRYSRFTIVDPVQLAQLAAGEVPRICEDLELQRRLELINEAFDPRGREILSHRILGDDWSSIARTFGYKNAHSAKIQFDKKVKRALSKIEFERPDRPIARRAGA